MPELPDVTVYIHALKERVVGRKLHRVRLASPFLLRSVEPPLTVFQGQTVRNVVRLGKRIVFEFDDELYLVIHLMIAGRFKWKEERGVSVTKKTGLAAFDFETGTLLFTEAGSKKRASLYAVQGSEALAEHQRDGVEVLECTLSEFNEALKKENRTLKRGLTDPNLFSGIGNAYSDEILHRAKLSPFKKTTQLDSSQSARLFEATQTVLREWIDRLSREAGKDFPEKVTAFRKEMAVHGRFGKACPVCGTEIQRISYASNEANYCPKCQTDGKLLADRSLSRLMKDDWPKTMEELENKRRANRIKK